MIKIGVLLGILLSQVAYFEAVAELYFPATSGSGSDKSLVVYSSLDSNAAEPLIRAFQSANPKVIVRYLELQTLDIYERVLSETDSGKATADIIISSAMDLQMKLANDGYGQAVSVPGSANWPKWAKWRDTAYALTFEPAVIAYHRPSFENYPVPRTRAELIELLTTEEEPFYGRIATYDIERAGVGFLFLARDEQHYSEIWRLVRILGASGVKLYSNSSAILERISDGRFAIGYNLLGSYADAWSQNNKDIGIILPADYTVVMSRIAIIPKAARSTELGRRFLQYLMSAAGQRVMADTSRLPALHPQVDGDRTSSGLRILAGDRLRPIPVSPGLLVYLDQVKRARLIKKWNDALAKN